MSRPPTSRNDSTPSRQPTNGAARGDNIRHTEVQSLRRGRDVDAFLENLSFGCDGLSRDPDLRRFCRLNRRLIGLRPLYMRRWQVARVPATTASCSWVLLIALTIVYRMTPFLGGTTMALQPSASGMRAGAVYPLSVMALYGVPACHPGTYFANVLRYLPSWALPWSSYRLV